MQPEFKNEIFSAAMKKAGCGRTIKDHLGNVRMVLTDKQKVDHYPTATVESAGLATEQLYYDIPAAAVVSKPTPLPTESSTLLDYINDNGTNNTNTTNPTGTSTQMMKLNSGSYKTGMSMVLKVMAGDQLDILGKSYYKQPTGTVTNSNFNATNIITAFLSVGGAANPAVLHGGTTGIITANTTGVMTPLGSFISNSNNTNPYNQVKAGVCYILFDEQFNLVSCQFDPVYIKLPGVKGAPGGPEGGLKSHFMQGINVVKNGYLYVYCSNESNVNVFFDNLEVVHTRGAILEETHYYPFGLVMAGISSKAAVELQNKDKTFQGQKFDDDLGIDWVQFKYRNHDPQIGRFIEIDPLSNKYVYNSTYAFSENRVTNHVELEGLESVEAAIANAWRELQGGIKAIGTPITNFIDNHGRIEHAHTTLGDVGSASGTKVSTGITETKTAAFNFTAVLENVVNTNTNKGTSIIKDVTTVGSVEVKTEIGGSITTKSNTDTKGVVAHEYGGKGAIKIDGVPVLFGIGFSGDSENKLGVSVQASTGPTPSYQVLAKAKVSTKDVSIGVGVQSKTNGTTTVDVFSFKFVY